MLELIRGLPQSAYELSLHDIVEHPSVTPVLACQQFFSRGGRNSC
jgi:hypothetical protein